MRVSRACSCVRAVALMFDVYVWLFGRAMRARFGHRCCVMDGFYLQVPCVQASVQLFPALFEKSENTAKEKYEPTNAFVRWEKHNGMLCRPILDLDCSAALETILDIFRVLAVEALNLDVEATVTLVDVVDIGALNIHAAAAELLLVLRLLGQIGDHVLDAFLGHVTKLAIVQVICTVIAVPTLL
jgi:hypothetical protein